jgi:hypothetical protein
LKAGEALVATNGTDRAWPMEFSVRGRLPAV